MPSRPHHPSSRPSPSSCAPISCPAAWRRPPGAACGRCRARARGGRRRSRPRSGGSSRPANRPGSPDISRAPAPDRPSRRRAEVRSTSGTTTGSPTTPSRRSQLSAKRAARSRSDGSFGWSTRMSSSRASATTGARARSANIRSTCSCHRRPNSSRLSTSSSTSTLGGSPASTGCSDRIRWAKLCTVPIAAESISASAASARARSTASVVVSCTHRSNDSRIRARSSLAAASVKVTAAISPIGTSRRSTRATTRATS